MLDFGVFVFATQFFLSVYIYFVTADGEPDVIFDVIRNRHKYGYLWKKINEMFLLLFVVFANYFLLFRVGGPTPNIYQKLT